MTKAWWKEPRVYKRDTSPFTHFPNRPCLPPKIFHKHCHKFIQGQLYSPGEIKNKGYTKFGGGGGRDKVNYRRCKNGEEWVAWQRRKNLLAKMFPRSLSSQLFRLFFFSILFLLRSRSHSLLLFELLYERDKCRKNITKLQTLTVCDKNFNLKQAIYNKLHR